jgi:hypothetical protein
MSLKTSNYINSIMSLIGQMIGGGLLEKQSPEAKAGGDSLLNREPGLRKIGRYAYIPELRSALHRELGERQTR